MMNLDLKFLDVRQKGEKKKKKEFSSGGEGAGQPALPLCAECMKGGSGQLLAQQRCQDSIAEGQVIGDSWCPLASCFAATEGPCRGCFFLVLLD